MLGVREGAERKEEGKSKGRASPRERKAKGDKVQGERSLFERKKRTGERSGGERTDTAPNPSTRRWQTAPPVDSTGHQPPCLCRAASSCICAAPGFLISSARIRHPCCKRQDGLQPAGFAARITASRAHMLLRAVAIKMPKSLALPSLAPLTWAASPPPRLPVAFLLVLAAARSAGAWVSVARTALRTLATGSSRFAVLHSPGMMGPLARLGGLGLRTFWRLFQRRVLVWSLAFPRLPC